MKISKKIKLNNNDYYIVVDVEYKKNKNHLPYLCLKDYKNNYWDDGNCSLLIKKVEMNYTLEESQKYDRNISYMSDILYIYDKIPFISGIKDINTSKDDNIPSSEGYIAKEEIKKYIKSFGVKMNPNHNFKLNDEETWK